MNKNRTKNTRNGERGGGKNHVNINEQSSTMEQPSVLRLDSIPIGKMEGAVLAKRDAWARIAGCMREEAGSVVGSVIV